MLAGSLESPDLRCDEMCGSMDSSYLASKVNKSTPPVDPLAEELGIHVLDCRKPFLPFSEFYNELLSDTVEMDRDFANYKSELGIVNYLNNVYTFKRYFLVMLKVSKIFTQCFVIN